MVRELGSIDALVQLKARHYNEALAEWLLDRREVRQFEFTGERYIQKKHPIFKNPDSHWGRAHFYAASKRLGPLNIPTGVFNLLVIWLGVALLYVTLYLDKIGRASCRERV